MVDGLEVELTGNKERDGAYGLEVRVAPGLLLGGLEQAIDSFDEAIGLVGPDPGDPPPWRCLRTVTATAFTGSNLERITLLHH